MKYLYFFSQLPPEFDLAIPNFDNYLKVLADNILLAVLFFFAFILVSFLFYYCVCFIMLFWHNLTGYMQSYQKENIAAETPSQVSSQI